MSAVQTLPKPFGVSDRPDHYKNFLVMPGEHKVSWEPAEIATLLGSCVSACVWDRKRKVGGMNHFMLPDAPADTGVGAQTLPMRYGLYAMEQLINDLMMMGCKKESLVAKVFGGANMTGASSDSNIGRRNSEFVLNFLEKDRIPLVSVDLGGLHSRRIRFLTDTGKVRVYKVPSADQRALQQENFYSLKIKNAPDVGDITFF